MTHIKDGAGLGTDATTSTTTKAADALHSISLEYVDALASFKVDRELIAAEDVPLWQSLFNGQLRLAVKCSACGRWLTANSSKRAHLGPRCAARRGGAK